MNRTLTLALLSAAIVLGGASGAAAVDKKKHPDARQAFGAQIVNKEPVDAREAYKAKGTDHPMWCDADPQCNGWAQWERDVGAGKVKYQPSPWLPRVHANRLSRLVAKPSCALS